MAEYIEKEAAEKILYDGCHTSNGRECPDDVVELWHMVQALPAADVAPVRHGRWQNPESAECYQCSVCGKFRNQEYGLDAPIFDNFCPNCGAKMDGGET